MSEHVEIQLLANGALIMSRRQEQAICKGRCLGPLLALLATAGCQDWASDTFATVQDPALRIIGGNARTGQVRILEVECGICHTIPGIPGANGIVGPSLRSFSRRQFIAGTAPNRPDTLLRFLSDAPSIAPGTAMPSLPISEQDARDIAAYLYTLY